MSTETNKSNQILVVLTATVAVFTSGLHTGWPAPSIPQLLTNSTTITAEEASYIVIIGNFGNFLGGFVGYFLLDVIGRHKTILLIALPQFLNFFVIFLADYCTQLLHVGRLMGGIAEGMTITIILLYIGEISEPQIRGSLCTLVSITLYLGVLFINIFGSYFTIQITALSFLFLPIFFIVIFWKMPESPYFLIMKNRNEEAVQTLQFLRQKNDVSKDLEVLKSDVARQLSEKGSFKDIFSIESNLRAFLVTVGARFFQLGTGMIAFNSYIQLLMKEATRVLSPEFTSSIILTIQLVMTVVSTFIVDRWGRKPLLLFSITGCFLNLLFQSIFFILKEFTNVKVSQFDFVPLLMMMLLIVLYSLGLGVIVSVLTSEMFSTSVKSKLSCLVNGIYALCMLVFIKFYQFSATFGLTFPFVSFTVVSCFGILFIYYFVPETKGKSLEEIQQELKKR